MEQFLHQQGASHLFDQQSIEQSIFRRFEQQVAQHPHRLAIKTDQHQLTYEQVNQAANRLARSLLSQRGEEHELIPILFEHGAMMIVAMLGVLKAGKGWVPIDPWYPPARIRYILETFEASLLLTNRQNLVMAQEIVDNQCPILNLDELDSSLPDENLNVSISPNTIACVLPTSGSTGEPKGVIHNHRNLLHTCMRWTNAFRICPDDRILLLNSYCHIGGINNIFSVVLNGATSYPFALKEKGLDDLVYWLIAEEITIYHSVSTVFRHLIDTLNGEEFPQLRLLHLGGEAVSKHDFELYKKHFSQDCIFLNSFGCTELSSYRQYFIDKSAEIEGHIIPVGYASEDTEVLLFDEAGKEVGFNVIGEIVVKSPYLALGYWKRPDLDALSFLSDPTDSNQRLYRTGDVGKMLPDGCLIHLGRKDSQVQIRGYRVEISECEAALSEHSQVKETAVLALDNELGEKFLAAYVVLYQDQIVHSHDLQAFLRQKLPNYMVPSTFIFLEALPLNPNGKVDRLALSKPNLISQHQPIEDTPFVAPEDELEAQIVKIWEKLLGIQPISIKDDFFKLGGHSLLAVKLFVEIEKMFGKNLPVATLFQATTVKDLTNIIRQQNWLAPWSSLVPMQPKGSKPPLFYIHSGGGNLLVYRELVYSLGTDQPIYGLQPKGLDGRFDPFHTVEDMADHYLSQIMSVQPEGPYFLAGFSSGGTIALEIAQRLHEKGKEVALLAMFDSAGPDYYKVLPLGSRIISVLRWFIADQVSRIFSWPRKSLQLIRQDGWSALYHLLLERLSLTQKQIDEDGKIQIRKSQSVIEADIKDYEAQANNPLEKWVNSLLIFLLKQSSAPHYAGTFARGLIRQGIDLLTDTLPESLYQVQAANRVAIDNYTPKPYNGPITYFRAIESPPGIYPPLKGGWDNIAIGTIEVFEIPGNHTSIMKSPILAEKLKVCLEKAQRDTLVKANESLLI